MATNITRLLGIDPRMYRHFAALTVAISAVVALFADGETQEAYARQQQHNELKHAEAEKFGKPRLADTRSDAGDKTRSGSFRDRFDAPMDEAAGTGGETGIVPAGMVVTAGPVIVEIDQAALARMTLRQRQAYLRMMEEERRKRAARAAVMPSPAQINALAEASATRAGSESID